MSDVRDIYNKWQMRLKAHSHIFTNYDNRNLKTWSNVADVEDMVIIVQNANRTLSHKNGRLKEKIDKCGADAIILTETDPSSGKNHYKLLITDTYYMFEQ